MNYTPNRINWQLGDMVLHDADAKDPRWLMVIIGRNQETGEFITRYPYFGLGDRKHSKASMRCYENRLEFLHDPRRWNIETANPFRKDPLPPVEDMEV